MSAYSTTVDVIRAATADDGLGSETRTPVVVRRGLACKQHLYSWSSQFREENSGNASGAGISERKLNLFVFCPLRGEFPDIHVDDQLTNAAGKTYNVLHVRQYGRTLQVDTEIVE